MKPLVTIGQHATSLVADTCLAFHHQPAGGKQKISTVCRRDKCTRRLISAVHASPTPFRCHGRGDSMNLLFPPSGRPARAKVYGLSTKQYPAILLLELSGRYPHECRGRKLQITCKGSIFFLHFLFYFFVLLLVCLSCFSSYFFSLL